MAPHPNHLVVTVQMRGHNMFLCRTNKNEGSQHMVLMRNKKNHPSVIIKSPLLSTALVHYSHLSSRDKIHGLMILLQPLMFVYLYSPLFLKLSYTTRFTTRSITTTAVKIKASCFWCWKNLSRPEVIKLFHAQLN